MTRHRRHGGGRRADPDKQACDRWLMETIIKAPYIHPPDHPLGSNLAEVRAYYDAARPLKGSRACGLRLQCGWPKHGWLRTGTLLRPAAPAHLDHPLRTRTAPAACRQPRAPPYPRKSVEPASFSSPVSAINAPESVASPAAQAPATSTSRAPTTTPSRPRGTEPMRREGYQLKR